MITGIISIDYVDLNRSIEQQVSVKEGDSSNEWMDGSAMATVSSRV